MTFDARLICIPVWCVGYIRLANGAGGKGRWQGSCSRHFMIKIAVSDIIGGFYLNYKKIVARSLPWAANYIPQPSPLRDAPTLLRHNLPSPGSHSNAATTQFPNPQSACPRTQFTNQVSIHRSPVSGPRIVSAERFEFVFTNVFPASHIYPHE